MFLYGNDFDKDTILVKTDSHSSSVWVALIASALIAGHIGEDRREMRDY